MRPRVLIVDDQVGDLHWLIDLIQNRDYEIVFATNEEAARERLRAVRTGGESYVLAIIDVMVAVKDLTQLMGALDDQFFEDSRNTGIRLCQYARRELGLNKEELPIACLTVRDDDEVRSAMSELGIPLFNRAPYGNKDSIRGFVTEALAAVKT